MLTLGSLIAAFLGGTFANASERVPETHLCVTHIVGTDPSLLPNILAALFPISAGILAFLYLKEMLPPPKTKSDDEDGDTIQSDEEEPSKYSDLFTPKINAIMLSFGLIFLMATAMSGLLPLCCFTPITNGGLGFDSTHIGRAMSVRAISTIVIQLGAFPYLQRRVGTLRLYRVLLVFWTPAFSGLPLVKLLARRGTDAGVWVGLVLTFACGSIANMANGEY